jgi:hypothetical protein
MKTYAFVALNKHGSSEIFLGDFAKMPTLIQANKELKIRKIVSKVIAVLESSRDVEMRYESMAWYLKPVQEVV